MRITIALFTLMLALPAFAQKLPSRKEVEEAGLKPYLRYTVPSGDMHCVSNSIFSTAEYRNKDARPGIDELPRDTAEKLGLAGKQVYNEFTDKSACIVTLEKDVLLSYNRYPDGSIKPEYMRDCFYDKKPYANRIQLVDQPVMPLQVVSQNLEQAPPQVSVNPNINVQPAPVQGATVNNVVPNSFDINLHGLPPVPIQQGMPSNITVTYHIVHEEKRDMAAKASDWASVGLKLGAGYALARTPDTLKSIMRGRNNSNERVALINGEWSAKAAAAYVPDFMQITANANPTTNSTSASNPNVNASPVNTATASPNVTANPNSTSNSQGGNGSLNPTITANGGEGGVGGQGGSGGQGGTGNGGIGNGGLGGNANATAPPSTTTVIQAPAAPDVTINNNPTMSATTGSVTTGPVSTNAYGGISNSESKTGPISNDSASVSGANSKSNSQTGPVSTNAYGGNVQDSGNSGDVKVNASGGDAKSTSYGPKTNIEVKPDIDVNADANAGANAKSGATATNNNSNNNENENKNEPGPVTVTNPAPPASPPKPPSGH